MAEFLTYAQHYWVSRSGPSDVFHEWGTKTEYSFHRLRVGDRLWVVVTGGPRYPYEWRLLQMIHIEAFEFVKEDLYGYRFRGDPARSRVYHPEYQPDLTPILKKLNFVSGRKIAFEGRKIGLALQNIRQLTRADGSLLEAYSRSLIIVKPEMPKDSL